MDLHSVSIEEVGRRGLDIEFDVEISAFLGGGAIRHSMTSKNLNITMCNHTTFKVAVDLNLLTIGQNEAE